MIFEDPIFYVKAFTLKVTHITFVFPLYTYYYLYDLDKKAADFFRILKILSSKCT